MIEPLCVTAPTALKDKLEAVAPRIDSPPTPSVIETGPVLATLIWLMSFCAALRKIAPAPLAKIAAPETVREPVCPIAPPELLIVRFVTVAFGKLTAPVVVLMVSACSRFPAPMIPPKLTVYGPKSWIRRDSAPVRPLTSPEIPMSAP